MPSITLSDAVLSESPKDKKEKKKWKNMETLASESAGKTKKDSKLKKESRKRKALEIDDDDEVRSETSSELCEPVNLKAESKKKKKKAKVEEEEDGDNDSGGAEEKSAEEHPNAISKFRISKPLKAKLKEKGIESLFPIQAMTFDTILDGSDLVGRARTGQVIFSFFTSYL